MRTFHLNLTNFFLNVKMKFKIFKNYKNFFKLNLKFFTMINKRIIKDCYCWFSISQNQLNN